MDVIIIFGWMSHMKLKISSKRKYKMVSDDNHIILIFETLVVMSNNY